MVKNCLYLTFLEQVMVKNCLYLYDLYFNLIIKDGDFFNN